MTTLRTNGYEGVRAPLLRPEFARARRAERERDWRDVRVTFVDMVPEGFGIPAGRRRVRVGVHLGRLTPADVTVHLTTGRAGCANVAARDVWTVRLASARSLRNGVFVFDGTVPERILEGSERVVAVVERRRRPHEPAFDTAPGVRRLVARPLEAPTSDASHTGAG